MGWDTAAGANIIRLGTGQLSAILAGATAISVSAFARDITSVGHILSVLRAGSVGDSGEGIGMTINSGPTVTLYCRPSGPDSQRSTAKTGSSSAWANVGGRILISTDQMEAFVNGVSGGVSSTPFTTTSWVDGVPTSPDYVADNADQSLGDGMSALIAEVAIWNGDIGAAGFASLAKRVSALMIRPDLLIFYMPLLRKVTSGFFPIDVMGASHATGGPVGGWVGEHPPIVMGASTIGFRRKAVVAPTGNPWLHYAQMRG
jgi:hypothetical protein